MFCRNCGNEVSDNAYVCPKCGAKIKEEVGVMPQHYCNGGGGGGGGGGAAASSSASSNANSTTVVIGKDESDSGLLFPIISMLLYIFIYPIGLILNIIGLFSGKRKGCFVSLFIVFFVIPAIAAAIFFAAAAAAADSIAEEAQQAQTSAAASTGNN